MNASPHENSACFQAHQKLREQALKKGYKPAKTPEELYGDFWPEDESIDDFLTAIRQLRQTEIRP